MYPTDGANPTAGSNPEGATEARLSDVMSHTPPHSPVRKLRSNARACNPCRLMKVKCDGFDSPPCVRCRKAGRKCGFRIPSRVYRQACNDESPGRPSQHSLSTGSESDRTSAAPKLVPGQAVDPGSMPSDASLTPRSNDFQGSHNTAARQETEAGCESHVTGDIIKGSFPVEQVAAAGLSDYFTSPLDTVNEHENLVSDRPAVSRVDDISISRRRQSHNALWTFSNPASRPQVFEIANINISRQDLRGMIRMFCDKILPNIPVLSLDDFRDVDNLIATDVPLVHCICYMTANFLPGGRQIKEMLLPSVNQILTGKFTGPRHQSTEISTLKALMILYTYAGCSSPSPGTLSVEAEHRSENLLFWPLKSVVEAYGLRLSLHRSLYDLQAEIRSGRPGPIVETTSYQKYIHWLQLFTMARYCFSMSGTPPSIPIDPTIRLASHIMDQIGMNPQACLFAETELCVIWEQVVARKQPGEWWCPRDPAEIFDERETMSMLQNADQMIDSWYHRWAEYINSDDPRGARLDYLGRSSRFSIHRFATRNLWPTTAGLSHLQKKQIQSCIYSASQVLDWALSLSPFEKERLRYLPESAGIMVSFCSLFIVASCQTLGSRIPQIFDHLEKVETAAKLKLDIVPNVEHPLHSQGLLILRRVDAVRQRLKKNAQNNGDDVLRVEATGDNSSPSLGAIPNEHMNETADFGLQYEGMSTMDMFWDFSMISPNFDGNF